MSTIETIDAWKRRVRNYNPGDLREERTDLRARMEAMLDESEAAQRDYSPSEQSTYNDLNSKFKRAGLAIDRLEERSESSGQVRSLVFPRADGGAWTTVNWTNCRARTWATACKRVGLEPVPRPYELRRSFASLLLAEGRGVHYTAGQLGQGAELTLRTYRHDMDEHEDTARIDAHTEIQKARADHGPLRGAGGGHRLTSERQNPSL